MKALKSVIDMFVALSLMTFAVWLNYSWIWTYKKVQKGNEFWGHVWAMNGEWLFHLIGCIAVTTLVLVFLAHLFRKYLIF